MSQMPGNIPSGPLISVSLGVVRGKVGDTNEHASFFSELTTSPVKIKLRIVDMLKRVPEGDGVEWTTVLLKPDLRWHDFQIKSIYCNFSSVLR